MDQRHFEKAEFCVKTILFSAWNGKSVSYEFYKQTGKYEYVVRPSDIQTIVVSKEEFGAIVWAHVDEIVKDEVYDTVWLVKQVSQLLTYRLTNTEKTIGLGLSLCGHRDIEELFRH